MTERPVILLVADAHRDVIEAEFRARYDRDYAIEVATSGREAIERATALCTVSSRLAMVAAEYQLPDTIAIDLLRKIQVVSPPSRRVASHWWISTTTRSTLKSSSRPRWNVTWTRSWASRAARGTRSSTRP
ncbi:hypothetical protein [Kocuria sp. JC486]|uniref:hypothetical protein n=1 Tax=Kocuria sp. JC486 TaxID=1970736 RepID=UPI001FD81B87|nr:hypothetical protein [Kocuria sp. JC486]